LASSVKLLTTPPTSTTTWALAALLVDLDRRLGLATLVDGPPRPDGRVGKITALTEPTDQAGKPKACTKCTGADKDKPIVGLVIIRDLRPSGTSYRRPGRRAAVASAPGVAGVRVRAVMSP
jgi:hypothetical protein